MAERTSPRAQRDAEGQHEPREPEQRREASVDEAAEQVHRVVNEATEKGFYGIEVDQTPNSAYTVGGVVAGEPVPEAAADPVVARREASGSQR